MDKAAGFGPISDLMTQYIVRRVLYMVLSLAVLSLVAFMIIQLPPGDYVTTFVHMMQQRGIAVDEAMMRALYERYAFDRAGARAVPQMDRQHCPARRHGRVDGVQ